MTEERNSKGNWWNWVYRVTFFIPFLLLKDGFHSFWSLHTFMFWALWLSFWVTRKEEDRWSTRIMIWVIFGPLIIFFGDYLMKNFEPFVFGALTALLLYKIYERFVILKPIKKQNKNLDLENDNNEEDIIL